MSSKDTLKYDVFEVKNRNGMWVVDKDGNPELGELLKTVTLSKRDADLLNRNAMGDEGVGFGKFYIEHIEKTEKQVEKDERTKENLWKVIDILVSEGKIEKPHHATGVDKLKTIIKEAE